MWVGELQCVSSEDCVGVLEVMKFRLSFMGGICLCLTTPP